MTSAARSNRRLVAGAILAVLVGTAATRGQGAGGPVTLYVSNAGQDGWSGRRAEPDAARKDGPFATIGRARDEIRALRAAGKLTGGATVVLQGGTYEQTETLAFGPKDGGTPEAPVVYRAAPGATVAIVGGKKVGGWTPENGSIVKANLEALGLKGKRPPLLVWKGKRMPLARYPNFDPQNPYGAGWAFADGQLVPMYQDVPGEVRNTLHYRAQDERTWSRPEEVEVFVFPRYNWWNNIVPIKSLEKNSRIITLKNDCSYPIRPGDRYYFRNAREELDAAGEWYVDPGTSTLSFWPPEPGTEGEVLVPLVGTLIRIDPGTANLTLRGFVLECAGGEAVSMRDATGCVVAGCTIRNVGDYHHAAVGVSGGNGNRVVGNDIHEVGSHGVHLDGGDRVTLTAAGNTAENNYIHHVGLEYKQGVGISLQGVGNRAAHNLIHDGPRMGIMFSGNNLVIEANEIRHVNLETEDTGAVYTGGRDWISSRGTVIRNNYFHDMLGFGKDSSGKWVSPHFAWGVYLDDNTGGVDVIGNVVARCSRAGLHLHNGRDNLIENNVFLDNGQWQHEYSGWTTKHSYWKDHFPTMVAGYEKVAGQPAWKSMRNMALHPKDAVLPDGTIMSGNRVVKNIFAYSKPESGYVRQNNFSFDRNLIDENVAWAGGKPIRTGVRSPGKAVGPNLAPNPGFETGGKDGLPADWQWQIRTPTAKAGLVKDGNSNALRIEAARDPAKERDNYPIVVSRDFAAQPGHSYQIRARMKASVPGAKAGLMLQSYVAGAYFWANWPNEVEVGPEWKDVAFTFTIPAEGDKGYHPQMKAFRARVDFPAESGALLVDDVIVEEITMLDEWASWQALGADRHSVVADPLFARPGTDDPALRPGSPAMKLGFRPIPFDKVGPYRDELRASWPIVQAPGAREYPVKVPQP